MILVKTKKKNDFYTDENVACDAATIREVGRVGRGTNPTVPPAVVLCTSQVSHVDRRTPWRGKIAFTYHEPLTPFEQVGNAYLLVLWRTDNGARRNLRTRMKRVLITHIPFLWSRDSFFFFFVLRRNILRSISYRNGRKATRPEPGHRRRVNYSTRLYFDFRLCQTDILKSQWHHEQKYFIQTITFNIIFCVSSVY